MYCNILEIHFNKLAKKKYKISEKMREYINIKQIDEYIEN